MRTVPFRFLCAAAVALLAVSGRELEAQDNEPWYLGVNLASAAFGGVYPGVVGTHYGWPQAEDLDYHKARGMELIRLPFRWERVQPELFGPLDAAEIARMDAFLDLAEQRGMLVIPDMHNFGRYHIGEGQNPPGYVIGSEEVPREAYADVWGRLAAHLKDRECIWAYDIMNEPYNMGVHSWKLTAQVGIDAVRQHDMRHTIMISGDSYSSSLRWPSASGDLHELVDPADDMIFQAHTYLDDRQSGDYDSDYAGEGGYPDVGVDRVRPFVQWLQTHGVRGFLGEFGVPDTDARWVEPLDRMIAYLEENNVSGTYWAAGPRWGGYSLRSNIRASHDESIQMRAMLPYLDGPRTNYWPPFTWFHDSINQGVISGRGYEFSAAGATVGADFNSIPSAHNSGRGIRITYSIPAGGEAGAGLEIEGGVDLAGNFAGEQSVYFSVMGDAGANLRVFFETLDGQESARVELSDHGTIGTGWQEVGLPLSRFLTAGFDGSQRILRLAFEGLPADGVSRTVHLDRVRIDRPDKSPPAISLSTSIPPADVQAGNVVTVTAEVEDAEGPIDFVEFHLDGQRFAIAEEAPYTASFTVERDEGHRLYAVTFDHYGNPARSQVLRLGESGFADGFVEEFSGESLDIGRWVLGSTGGNGSLALADGEAVLQVGSQAAAARAALLSQRHSYDPFRQSLVVNCKASIWRCHPPVPAARSTP